MTWCAVSPNHSQPLSHLLKLQRALSYQHTTMSRKCSFAHISDDMFAHILAYMRSPDILLCVPDQLAELMILVQNVIDT